MDCDIVNKYICNRSTTVDRDLWSINHAPEPESESSLWTINPCPMWCICYILHSDWSLLHMVVFIIYKVCY